MIKSTEANLRELRQILRRHLTDSVHAYVFGSRATGRAHLGSDMDILLESAHPIPWETLAILEDALSESDLPFRVDLLDAARTSPQFLQRIAPEKVAII